MKVRHAIYGLIGCMAALQVNEALAYDPVMMQMGLQLLQNNQQQQQMQMNQQSMQNYLMRQQLQNSTYQQEQYYKRKNEQAQQRSLSPFGYSK